MLSIFLLTFREIRYLEHELWGNLPVYKGYLSVNFKRYMILVNPIHVSTMI